MKNKKYVILIIFLLIICILVFPNVVYGDYNIQEELGTSDLSEFAQIQNQGSSPEFESKIGEVLGIIATAGSVLSIIALIGIGIKYVTGSIGDKVEYKKSLKPYIIGAIMIFGISNLLNILYKVFPNIF